MSGLPFQSSCFEQAFTNSVQGNNHACNEHANGITGT